jgi:putative tryptophan/tyrosine transport system substrate-binding protein
MKRFWILDPSVGLRTCLRFWIGGSKNKKAFCFTLCALLLTLCVSAEAQQPKNVPRIGYLRAEKVPEVDIEGFRQGLREHGYVEGKNIVVEYRWADGNEEKLRSLVSELIGLKVDLIVTSAPAATQAAKEATRTTPIVMVLVADPVAFGFVNSLARPGGNITGFAFLLPEISGKRLELLKETVPKLSRVAVLWNAANPYKETDLKEVQPVADALKVAVHTFRVRDPNGFDDAFKAATKARAEGLLTLDDPFTLAHRTRITDLAVRYKLPAVYSSRPFVDAAGLMSYGPDRVDQNRRAAMYVDRILKGVKPVDLPVERPTKFEFVINLKTAKQIGLTIPPNVLARADKVIR